MTCFRLAVQRLVNGPVRSQKPYMPQHAKHDSLASMHRWASAYEQPLPSGACSIGASDSAEPQITCKLQWSEPVVAVREDTSHARFFGYKICYAFSLAGCSSLAPDKLGARPSWHTCSAASLKISCVVDMHSVLPCGVSCKPERGAQLRGTAEGGTESGLPPATCSLETQQDSQDS